MTGAGPGLEKLKMPGPGRDRNFFIAGAGPGFKFFYCRGRGRAGIKKILLLGPGRDLYFFIAGVGPGLKILK